MAQTSKWFAVVALAEVLAKLELLEKDIRDGISHYRVRIEVSSGVMQHGFLLVPAGNTPRPAVLVPYYVPEVSVDYQGPLEGQAKTMMTEGSRGNPLRAAHASVSPGRSRSTARHPDAAL